MNAAEGLFSTSQLDRTDALSVLFDTSSDCVALITIDGRLARVNRSGLDALEIRDPASVLGAQWASLWPAAQQADAKGAIQQARSGAVGTFQGYGPTARGLPKWWDVTVSPIRDESGEVVALLAVSRDVSDAAQGRQALVTLEEGGLIRGWSPQAQEMFGWSAGEAIGRSIDVLVPEGLRQQAQAWSEQILTTGAGERLGRPIRSVAVRRTGEEFPVECVMSALPTAEGWMLLAAVQDVSAGEGQTELFEVAFHSAPIGEALVSLDGRFLKVNAAFCALVGLDEQALLSRDFQSITHPGDLEANLDHLQRLAAGEIPHYQLEKRYVRADGSRVWANLTVSLVRFADGRPKFIIAQVQDLTERRTAEERYRLLAENVSDVVSMQDAQGRCLYASPSALRVFGYQPDDVIGVTRAHFIPERALAAHLDFYERVARLPPGEPLTEQLEITRRDGSPAWVEVSCRNAEDADGAPITVVVTRDISRRHEIEHRYRLLTDNMADILVLADLNGRMTFVTGACERILGWTPEEILERRGELLLHPEDYERVHGAFLRIGQGEQGLRVRFRSRCKDGSWRWLESQPSLIVDHDGSRMIADVIRDVTVQVAQEQALAEAREQAEAAALAKARFLANMSHEIRTPLTSVIGFSDLLLGRDDLQADVHRYAERISSASRALLALVNDILDFSKIEAGQFEIRPAPARPRELMEDCMAIFSSAVEAKGLRLRLETRVEPATVVEIDSARLRQVLLNLIGNAVKFTEAGEVVLRLDCSGGRLSCAVQDSGPGIAPDDQRKLFRRFSQVDASSTRRHGGTGLGLAICKGLVEAMGGSISVRSRPGKGSTFEFEISAPVAADAARLQAGTPEEAHIDRVKILVADDNPANRELVRAILEGFGAEVTDAGDGHEAVEIAASAPFDVILMDLRMPNLDGRGALQRLRARRGPNRRTPVLAFTADVLDTELTGFDGTIAKPIEPLRLAEVIEACLRSPAAAPADRSEVG